ncbi:hypothetical protein [Alicyclobacillus fodiniaquatilis]|uniref:Uncharacterized protein n=1 Tax=Alicyclobacillus fodiniaquatilis TaxID=1661150 RepID=A0ABW4JMV4_9BACL
MGKEGNPLYNDDRVVELIEVKKVTTAVIKLEQRLETSKLPPLVTKNPKSALELSDMLGCSGAYGKTMVDIHKETR